LADPQDQLLDPVPSSVSLNEQWISGKEDAWAGNNWVFNAQMQGSFTTPTGDPARFADNIDGGRKLNESPYPVPGCSGDGTMVDHWEQQWRVGSTAIGFGRSVQIDTLERHKDFGRHSNIRY
jgi:hypothetical protein